MLSPTTRVTPQLPFFPSSAVTAARVVPASTTGIQLTDAFTSRTTGVTAQATRPADGLKSYEELSAGQKSLLGPGGAAGWSNLSTKDRGVFLLLTERLQSNGINLEGLSLQGGLSGINGSDTRFELKFDHASSLKLKAQVDAKIAQGSFFAETPKGYFHKGYTDSGARENREKYSMQLGFGPSGAFVDMDRYNPRSSSSNWVKHWGEILTPGNIDPMKAAREIGTSIFSKL